MTNIEISDIILDDLKNKSPRHLLTDILSPRKLWERKDEQQIKTIITILKKQDFISIIGGDKYFPATDMQLAITSYGHDILNQIGTYSYFTKKRMIQHAENSPKKRSTIEVTSWIIGILAGLALLYEFVLKHWFDIQ